ncbi:juvenile hormone esterase-like isoform X2 [Thrips palmi]|uniref:Carboxylic ester hydrolase n=1 Tax=Thrips palmi TaxID=161013 RepID=A0A6P8ZZ95_THRPL|nr:juvenile hormone esterase-like isoform X2 [Thrips palmi]
MNLLLAVGLVVAIVAVALIAYFATKDGDSPGPATTPATAPTSPPVPTTPRPRGPVVKVEQGQLEGAYAWTQGTDRVRYASFLGVPFAQAPIGQLRFKAPRPHPGWQGVRPATEVAPKCAQGMNGVLEGSEDCLYLNVFTANLNEAAKAPVFVFIHGGMFLGGSADPARFGPDYLLPHGVIVVTVQYRLASLGLLSLDTEGIPGNCATKDNIAALQWVHNNIAAFGGDSDRVTIGGQSAGSGLASWLTMLPQTKGLVHGAILMSGTTFHSWDYKESHVATALKVASSLAGRPVTDLQDAERYLMGASIEELHRHDVLVGDEERQSQPELPFVPTPERRPEVPGGEPRVITRDAESYFYDPAAPAIPFLISNTNAEWRFYYYSNNPELDPKVDEEMVTNLARHVPKNLLPFQDTRKILGLPESTVDYDTIIEEVRQGIRSAVTQNCDLGCTLKTYFDNIWETTDTHRLAMFRAKQNKADTFLFKFSVRTELNSRLATSEDVKDVAVHSDDLRYVMASATQTEPSAEAALAIKRMSTMWANFITYGKPIPEPVPELLPVNWPPNTSADNDVTYLELKADGFTLHADSFSGPMIQFWRDLYTKYRAAAPAPAPSVGRSVRAPGRARGL